MSATTTDFKDSLMTGGAGRYSNIFYMLDIRYALLWDNGTDNVAFINLHACLVKEADG